MEPANSIMSWTFITAENCSKFAISKTVYKRAGMDVERMERGITAPRPLSPPDAIIGAYHTAGGLMGGLALFDLDEDALYWLRMRQQVTLRSMAAIRKQIDLLDRKTKLGTIPRATTFSVLTAQDYQKTHVYFDYLFPKHYFWNRGFDGMYGTIARWVRKVGEWNPSLEESDCFAVVKAWFGIELPKVHSLADLDEGFPDEFFSKIVSRKHAGRWTPSEIPTK